MKVSGYQGCEYGGGVGVSGIDQRCWLNGIKVLWESKQALKQSVQGYQGCGYSCRELWQVDTTLVGSEGGLVLMASLQLQ